MKKSLFALVLAVCIVCSMAVAVYAAPICPWCGGACYTAYYNDSTLISTANCTVHPGDIDSTYRVDRYRIFTCPCGYERESLVSTTYKIECSCGVTH